MKSVPLVLQVLRVTEVINLTSTADISQPAVGLWLVTTFQSHWDQRLVVFLHAIHIYASTIIIPYPHATLHACRMAGQ